MDGVLKTNNDVCCKSDKENDCVNNFIMVYLVLNLGKAYFLLIW